MAVILAFLAPASFAVVLTGGTVQAQGLRPEGPASKFPSNATSCQARLTIAD